MANSKLKTLVILSPGFPENEADSTCIPPQQIFVKALEEVYPNLNIIVLTFEYPFFSATYQWHGIKVISFGSKNNSRFFRLLTGLRVGLVLKKLHKNHQIVGLLSFWFGKCALVGNAFAKKHKLPHYCWILGRDAKAGNKYFDKIRPAGSSLIALSDFIAREFNKNYSVMPRYIIPVGIDIALFGTTSDKRDIDVLGVGSLIPLKQYHVFLEMLQLLKAFLPNVKAAICGDGPEMERLKAIARSMNLEGNISFYGKLPHAAVLTLMQRSKILLHPSEYEGFGAICLEALYAGAHVISFIRPMDEAIKNWHIAACKTEMLKLLIEKLQSPNLNHEVVLPYTIQANAKALMQLFDHNEAEIS